MHLMYKLKEQKTKCDAFLKRTSLMTWDSCVASMPCFYLSMNLEHYSSIRLLNKLLYINIPMSIANNHFCMYLICIASRIDVIQCLYYIYTIYTNAHHTWQQVQMTPQSISNTPYLGKMLNSFLHFPITIIYRLPCAQSNRFVIQANPT